MDNLFGYGVGNVQRVRTLGIGNIAGLGYVHRPGMKVERKCRVGSKPRDDCLYGGAANYRLMASENQYAVIGIVRGELGSIFRGDVLVPLDVIVHEGLDV